MVLLLRALVLHRGALWDAPLRKLSESLALAYPEQLLKLRDAQLRVLYIDDQEVLLLSHVGQRCHFVDLFFHLFDVLLNRLVLHY